jgi:hypothetical protein
MPDRVRHDEKGAFIIKRAKKGFSELSANSLDMEQQI